MITRRSTVKLCTAVVICLCSQRLGATNLERKGCWLRSAQGGYDDIFKTASQSSGNEFIDRFCANETKLLNEKFSVHPSLLFFNDGDRPNAYAAQRVTDSNTPSGTVLIGKTLVSTILAQRSQGDLIELAAVMAHEWGHILQFIEAFNPEWPVYYELHADSAAGWYLANTRRRQFLESNKTRIGRYFNSLGDEADFNKFDFHGTSKQRENAVLTSSGLADCEACGGQTSVPKNALDALGLSGAN